MLDDVLHVINLLAAMIWTGGMVAVTIATFAARATLTAEDQVRFFRLLGRRYGVVSGIALIVFAASGLALAGSPSQWTGAEGALAALTVLIAALTIAGVRNARAVGRLRSDLLAHPGDATHTEALEGPVRAATILRGLIAASTLVAVLVGAPR